MTKFGVLAILTLSLGTYSFGAKAAVPAFVDDTVLVVEVHVDTELCASMPIQCAPGLGSDHTQVAASSSNHNPVILFVLVSKREDGVGVSGLVDTDFTFVNRVGPAGATAAIACGFDDCGIGFFSEASEETGLYFLTLDVASLSGTPPWETGTYAATLAVSFVEDGKTFNGIALVTFTIP